MKGCDGSGCEAEGIFSFLRAGSAVAIETLSFGAERSAWDVCYRVRKSLVRTRATAHKGAGSKPCLALESKCSFFAAQTICLSATSQRSRLNLPFAARKDGKKYVHEASKKASCQLPTTWFRFETQQTHTLGLGGSLPLAPQESNL